MNKNYKYTAKIIPLTGRFDSELYLYRQDGERIYGLTINEDGTLIETEYNIATTNNKPFIVARETIIRAILESLEEVKKPLGVQDPIKEYSQGKLEATEKHLEDMRTLVFKKNNK